MVTLLTLGLTEGKPGGRGGACWGLVEVGTGGGGGGMGGGGAPPLGGLGAGTGGAGTGGKGGRMLVSGGLGADAPIAPMPEVVGGLSCWEEKKGGGGGGRGGEVCEGGGKASW